jgi:4-amino-4-deoxy-L-arabinose transferase-like glycosyltransferase
MSKFWRALGFTEAFRVKLERPPIMKHFFKELMASTVFIVGFAFALRMFVMWVIWSHMPAPIKVNVPYGFELGRVARAIAAGEGFSSPLRDMDTGPTAWFTPLYPYLVAGIFKIWGIYSEMSRLIIATTNCAFAALTIIPIHGIAKRTFGERVAIGASWVWVFLPTALHFPVIWIWDTTLTALFFMLIFWATLALRGTRSALPWAGYGALWVVGGLTNPSILSLFPFFLGWLIWNERKNTSVCVKHAAAVLLLFTIGLVPWTVRNYRVFGKFIVLRSNFGLELWLGNNPNVIDMLSQLSHPNDNPEEAEKYRRMGEIAYMAEKEHEAFAFMRTHPVETLNNTFHRFVDIWISQTDRLTDLWSTASLYGKALLTFNCLLSLLGLLGVLYANRSRHPDAAPFGMVLLVFPMVFYLTHSSPRYRFPMDPIIVVLAVSSFAHLMTLSRRAPSEARTGFRRASASDMAQVK